MFRRTIWLGAMVLWLAVLPASVDAALPEGPRLAVTAWSIRQGSVGLVRVDQFGGTPETLFARSVRRKPLPVPLNAPAWSPDGQMLAFSAVVGKKREGSSVGSRTKIFVISAEGGEPQLVPVPGTDEGLNPVFAPDGHTIAFSRERRRLRPNSQGGSDVAYESESIWTADIAGAVSAQLTPWRNGLHESPSSFSPDGTTLTATRGIGDGDTEAISIQLASRATTVIAKGALEPVYSPDGSEIAFLKGHRRTESKGGGSTTATVTDLFTMRTDGTEVRRLTRTPKAVEIYPSWDPSGDRILFTRLGNPFGGGGLLGLLRGEIAEVNRDGTCPTRILKSSHFIFSGATWQPGPGRGAGPIAC